MTGDDVLSCSGCGKTVQGRFSCPTCAEIGLPPSYYCTKDCFRSDWPKHKALHIAAANVFKQPTRGRLSLESGITGKTPDKWKDDADLSRFLKYNFTGPLRPWPQTYPARPVPSHIPRPDYAITGIPEGEHAEQKHRSQPPIEFTDPTDIEKSRAACKLGREALDLAGRMVQKRGVTGDEIDKAVHDFIISRGAYPSPLNYYNFPKSCCISVNEVICHGIPDLRPFEKDDIVNIDISVYLNGFHADLNETYIVGEQPCQESRDLVQAAYDSLMAAIAICKPETPYREIGNAVAGVVEPRGFSVVRSYVGHGCNTLFHCRPNVPHYKKNKAIGIMKPGHIFTIEPMINAGGWEDTCWPDDWTVVTRDGKRSAQFEHTLLITETGCEVLTARLPDSPPNFI